MKRLALISTLFTCAAAHAQLYHVTDIGTLPEGSGATSTALNARGQVVGYASSATGWQAFLWSNGTLTGLGSIGGGTSYAWGINSAGQVVGENDTSVTRAFLYSNGVMQDIGTLGGADAAAYGINDLGQVVGYADLPGSEGLYDAFLYSAGSMQDIGNLGVISSANVINNSGFIAGDSELFTGSVDLFGYSAGNLFDFGTLGGQDAFAMGINGSGVIVGWSYVSGFGPNGHAFIYSNGAFTDLDPATTVNASANGINSAGQVVGGSGSYGAFLYSSGVMHSLNSMLDSSGVSYIIDSASGINDTGVISASGRTSTSNGYEHALLLTPVASHVVLPSSYSLIVGTQASGSLYSIQFNDSWYLTAQPGVTTLLSEAPLQVQLTGTSPTMSPASFQFTFAGHVNSINLSQSILLYNYQTGSFETLNTTAAHVGSDQTVTVTPTENLSRFVNQSNGLIKAQVNFSRAGFTSVLRWTASLGVANWIIQ